MRNSERKYEIEFERKAYEDKAECLQLLYGKVWQSKPTTFERALRAWKAAASSQADPYHPPYILDSYNYKYVDPNVLQLLEICEEAYNQACWLPFGKHHPVPPAHAEFWQRKRQYGLCWRSGVQTILARTSAGWVVRIVGEHLRRQEAAERILLS